MFQTVQRRALRGIDVYRATATVLVVAAIVLAAIAAVATDVSSLAAAPVLALLACAAAGLLHFGLGWTLLGVSQVRLGAPRTGIVVGTVPLFGALVAALVLDEPLGAIQVGGLLLTVAGVVVVVRIRGRRTPVVATRAPSASADAVPDTPSDLRVGVLAGLATAACWSVSPVLIRYGLRDLESPLLAAAVGMTACATAYAVGIVATGNLRHRPVDRDVWPLLLVSGTAVSVAILLQWTSYDLTTIAVALAVLQFTPPLVVALSARVAGDVLAPAARRRAWSGAGLTLVGSLALVLAA